ncbi:MAG: hypothetical protein A2Y41_10400 [Spirochaetes bacterium GWB1_36_13]|nr:MAG: hypothetical protein A2Y41_10400 [Spirochaetes bacterium GWB1_36_13]
MKNRLNGLKWQEFFINEVFPNIQRGKRLKTNDHFLGKMPYISSTALNNGVDNFISNTSDVRIFSNCLSIANSGSVGACFYQPYRFIASDHVTKLENPNFNKYIYLFIANIVSRLDEKYSYNREINDNRIKKEKILLPVNLNGKPDYEFMESFMQDKEQLLIEKYKKYILSKIEGINYSNNLKFLSQKEWKEFKIGKLFERLVPGKSKGLNHLNKSKKGINYLGATNQNNGVLCQVNKDNKLIQKGNCIAFIRNGEGSMGYSVYKAEDFIATSDMTLGYSPNINRYSGTFITTVADKVRGKYNFGYKRSSTRLEKESIILPINENENPDYHYMEEYMQLIEYKKIIKYLEYLENQNKNK